MLTTDEAKKVLRCPYKPLALTALTYVNLTDHELNVLILRYMRGHTQEQVAEETGYSVNGLQKQERAALDKCCKAWQHLKFIEEVLKVAQ